MTKQLNIEELEKVSGGAAKKMTIILTITFNNPGGQHDSQDVTFEFETPITDDMMKKAAEDWCKEKYYEYLSYELKPINTGWAL